MSQNITYLNRLLNEIKDHIEACDLYSNPPLTLIDDYNALNNNIKSALLESHRVNAETLEETYQVQVLYERIKAITFMCQIFRLHIDRIDHHAQQALSTIKTLSVAIESSEPTNEDADL